MTPTSLRNSCVHGFEFKLMEHWNLERNESGNRKYIHASRILRKVEKQKDQDTHKREINRGKTMELGKVLRRLKIEMGKQKNRLA
ncbi:hypothetical protein C0J52_10051 [Blattella germanica]|nr:hypothetical protein C0J52_10051 [Blattella germanica]